MGGEQQYKAIQPLHYPDDPVAICFGEPFLVVFGLGDLNY